MRNVLVPFTLALLVGCTRPSKRESAEAVRAHCDCRATMEEEGCECPHCAGQESGMEPADCPCSRRPR